MTHLSGLASQADVWFCATDGTRRKTWAEARLAQPIPAVGSTNDVTSSSVDKDHRHTEMGATTRPRRIQWTEDLDADLVRCNDATTLPEEVVDENSSGIGLHYIRRFRHRSQLCQHVSVGPVNWM